MVRLIVKYSGEQPAESDHVVYFPTALGVFVWGVIERSQWLPRATVLSSSLLLSSPELSDTQDYEP